MITPVSLYRSNAAIEGSTRWLTAKMMTTLRVVAYALALVAIAMAVPLTIAAGARGLVVGVLAGTLAVTPYVVVRALEEVMSASVPPIDDRFLQ
jgi:hypothetical protein